MRDAAVTYATSGPTVGLTRSGPNATVTMTGELDVGVAPEVDAAVDAALAVGSQSVVLDLGGATFIDCRGVRATLRALSLAEERSARLAIVPPPDAVHRVFALCGVEPLLPFVPSEGLRIAC